MSKAKKSSLDHELNPIEIAIPSSRDHQVKLCCFILQIYDDNRLNHQAEITDLLADLV